jgi:dsRNA-specific ribonuclease
MKQTIKEFSRSAEERTNAVLQSSLDDDLPQARIWTPIYDPFTSYITYGPSNLSCDAIFPDQSEDIESYSDYFTKARDFKVEKKARLFVVQRLWYLPKKIHKHSHTTMFEVWKKKLKTDLDLDDDCVLQDGERSPCEGLVAALLPATACMEAPIADASLFIHFLLLPQILYHLDQLMTAQLFVEYCVENLPKLGSCVEDIAKESLDNILEALIAKSCVMNKNYDKLEWLGDAVLKLIHTESLVHSRDLRKWVSFLHEGDLSLLRSAMGSNVRLANAAKSAGFDRFILYRQLGRNQVSAVVKIF